MYLKLSKFLQSISFKLKQKSLYFELKYFIKNKKTYLKLISGYERGIGKTYTLLQLAHKYKCPVAVPNYMSGEYLKNEYKKLYNKQLNIIVTNESSKGRREKMILCEEGITYKQINEILKPMTEIIVGYKTPDYKSDLELFKKEYKYNWID